MDIDDKDTNASVEIQRLETVLKITREQLYRALGLAAELEAMLLIERGKSLD